MSFEALLDEWASSTLHIAASAIAKRAQRAIKHIFGDPLKGPGARSARTLTQINHGYAKTLLTAFCRANGYVFPRRLDVDQ